MATPTLNLQTLVDRPTVAIDGVAYPLRATDEFSILEFERHLADAQRLPVLTRRGLELSDEEALELCALLDRYCRRVLTAPAEVQARLSDVQRLQVVSVFLRLLGSPRPTPGARTRAEATPATGASSSPVSPDSTAGVH